MNLTQIYLNGYTQLVPLQHLHRYLKFLDQMSGVNVYDENKQLTQRSIDNVHKTAVSQKKRKTKHLFVPTVWYEGKKMIIRGKAVLQKSNDEITHILERKAKAQRHIEFKTTTDKEVRSGTQATLTNFCKVNVSTQPKVPSNGSDDKHYESTDEMEDLSWVAQERDMPMIPDWPRTMLYISSLEDE